MLRFVCQSRKGFTSYRGSTPCGQVGSLRSQSVTQGSVKPPRGFTLIELLVVIAIIGVLASVVMAGLSRARESARDARRLADLREFRTAMDVYFSDNGTYPVTQGYLSAGGASQLFSGGYLKAVPVDPAGSSASWYPYVWYYWSSDVKRGFMIRHYLEEQDKYCIYATEWEFIHPTWQGYLNSGSYVYCAT